MVHAHLDIKKALDEVAPTYYEQFTTSRNSIPCITYNQVANGAYVDGTSPNLHYSTVEFDIKVWAHSLAEALPIQEDADAVMKSLGFRRVAYRELSIESDVCCICSYKGLGLERDR